MVRLRFEFVDVEGSTEGKLLDASVTREVLSIVATMEDSQSLDVRMKEESIMNV